MLSHVNLCVVCRSPKPKRCDNVKIMKPNRFDSYVLINGCGVPADEGFMRKIFKKKTRIAAPAIPFSSGTLLPLSEFDPDDLQSDHATVRFPRVSLVRSYALMCWLMIPR